MICDTKSTICVTEFITYNAKLMMFDTIAPEGLRLGLGVQTHIGHIPLDDLVPIPGNSTAQNPSIAPVFVK